MTGLVSISARFTPPPHSIDPSLDSPSFLKEQLLKAVENGAITEVEKLLQSDIVTSDMLDAALSAVPIDFEPIIILLLNGTSTMNKVFPTNMGVDAILEKAASTGNSNLVSYILNNGKPSSLGMNYALMAAVMGISPDSVQSLFGKSGTAPTPLSVEEAKLHCLKNAKPRLPESKEDLEGLLIYQGKLRRMVDIFTEAFPAINPRGRLTPRGARPLSPEEVKFWEEVRSKELSTPFTECAS